MKDDLFSSRPKMSDEFPDLKDGKSESSIASKEKYLNRMGLGKEELDDGFKKLDEDDAETLRAMIRFPFGAFK